MASRQFLGSKGTSSEPKVNTAASNRVRSAAPMPKVHRCFGSSELIENPESRAAEGIAADIRCNADCACGHTPCRCERSERGIHYTVARPERGCSRRAGEFLRRSVAKWRDDAARACGACRRQLRIPDAPP